MSETILIGLYLTALGTIALVSGRFLIPALVRGRSRSHPDRDTSRYERGQKIYLRFFAGTFILVGVSIVVFGLFGGILPGR